MRPLRLPGGALIVAACMVSGPNWAAVSDGDELFELSLDQLMQVQVTSVSRRPEELRHAPSAIYVISADDIRRSGATSIPEVLRLAPGLNVRRAAGDKWSISARGFDRLYANKLLVMVDGRTVYTPTFSGVYWDVQDLVMQDIERIEVIRGPGAVMWGANAVNGVINIITRDAKDTTGTLVSVAAGTEDRAIGTARYGAETKSGGAWRSWVKASDRDAASLRSYWLYGAWELDGQLRYVDSVQAENIDAYTELNLRIGRQLSEQWRASLSLTNLLHDSHAEAAASDSLVYADSEVERAVLLSLEWQAERGRR